MRVVSDVAFMLQEEGMVVPVKRQHFVVNLGGNTVYSSQANIIVFFYCYFIS